MRIQIVDSLSMAGDASRPNEDRHGDGAGFAFVIDGATGLGPDFMTGKFESDAAWLAEFAKVHMEYMLPSGRPVSAIVADVNTLAASIVSFAAGDRDLPAWQLPVAGFQLIREEEGALATYGLGDCVLAMREEDGPAQWISPLDDGHAHETQMAKARIKAAGGLAADPQEIADETLVAAERELRASYNQPGSRVWTLGTARQAGEHVVSQSLSCAPPAAGILMTDGFSALVDKYRRYDADALLDAAMKRRKLDFLAEELRQIETVEDPDGLKFPRMKVSDDATAILFEITT